MVLSNQKVNQIAFSDQTVSQIKTNIFQVAWGAIDDWSTFPWHSGGKSESDSHQINSSQALAIDVFGTLRISEQRNAILNCLADHLGLPTGQDWEIELEYYDKTNLLEETHQTWVDAVARSSSSLIFFECKFTETDGGSCRQPLTIPSGANQGRKQCTGNYEMQLNPVNQAQARCALTGKGIRYWDFIPSVFMYRNDIDYDPCPFRLSWYQWMRNLTNCYAQAKAASLKPAFVVVYADTPTLPMPRLIQSPSWRELTEQIRQENIVFKTLSYQNLIEIACQNDPTVSTPWQELKEWVNRKIERACSNQ